MPLGFVPEVTVLPTEPGAAPAWSWHLITDIQEMWSFPLMVNAFRVGAVVAVVSAAMGYFVVLWRQTFAAHTLSTVAFPGAAGAVLFGISAVYGYFAVCVVAAPEHRSGVAGCGTVASKSRSGTPYYRFQRAVATRRSSVAGTSAGRGNRER
ncbi:metal ABC transporter permease [Streptomyces lydicamycinicus]|uniref:metal ABC transporter permease n=1 Tax=Streptomyces lydicamycinicus TaxID=1546107 RepID=UPI00203524EB|nr:metal ABC transporter permease [Streptomyces lydicamycinicus]USA04961.1 metal ABC transporter permease [Streptomyces lydicamycinicus]